MNYDVYTLAPGYAPLIAAVCFSLKKEMRQYPPTQQGFKMLKKILRSGGNSQGPCCLSLSLYLSLSPLGPGIDDIWHS